MTRKPSMGSQKIKIAKIEIKNHLQVTFSKRRSGLFKKASELCTLCGVEVAIVDFSPAGKVFSFGHPNVDSIVDRFLSQNPNPNPNVDPMRCLLEAHRNASLHELNLQLTQIMSELEAERRRVETLCHMRKFDSQELGLHELEQVRVSMEELKKNVNNEVNKVLVEAQAKPSPFESKYLITQINGFSSNPHHDQFHSFGYDYGFF